MLLPAPPLTAPQYCFTSLASTVPPTPSHHPLHLHRTLYNTLTSTVPPTPPHNPLHLHSTLCTSLTSESTPTPPQHQLYPHSTPKTFNAPPTSLHPLTPQHHLSKFHSNLHRTPTHTLYTSTVVPLPQQYPSTHTPLRLLL